MHIQRRRKLVLMTTAFKLSTIVIYLIVQSLKFIGHAKMLKSGQVELYLIAERRRGFWESDNKETIKKEQIPYLLHFHLPSLGLCFTPGKLGTSFVLMKEIQSVMKRCPTAYTTPKILLHVKHWMNLTLKEAFGLQHNDVIKVKQWINQKDINALDRYGYTALHYASRNGHLDMCKLLISYGANVNALTRSGRVSPLHRCVSMGHCDIFKLLLDSGAQIDVKDGDGKTILHRAVEGGHCQLVEKILKMNPSLAKVTDKRGLTPKECSNISGTLYEILNKYEMAE